MERCKLLQDHRSVRLDEDDERVERIWLDDLYPYSDTKDRHFGGHIQLLDGQFQILSTYISGVHILRLLWYDYLAIHANLRLLG